MRSIIATPALSYDGHEYLVGDLVLVAMRSGSWAWLEAQARVGWAARRECEAHGDEIDRDAVRTAGQMFRHARGLLSGEDLRAWLAARDLTPDDWIAWLERSLLAGRHTGDGEELVDRHPPSEQEVAAVLRVDGLCSGALRAAADRLLAHAAAAHATTDRGVPSAEPDVTTHATALADRIVGLEMLPPPDLETRLRHLANLEADADRFSRDLVNSEAVDRVLLARRLEWARIGWQELAFPGEGAAREVAMFVRQDGMTLSDVADMLGVELIGRGMSLAEVEPDLAALLAGAVAGDLLGPVETEVGWRVLSIRERILPSRADGPTFGRALEEIQSQAIERQLAGRVRWHVEL